MTMRSTATLGSAVGLIAPTIVLMLLWRYGIWEIMFRSIDLRAVLWPSSIMLSEGWCCTLPGLLTTVSSVAINYLLYAAVALLLRAGIRAIKGGWSAEDRTEV